MDDPKVAFPLFEKARERGLKTVAVHILDIDVEKAKENIANDEFSQERARTGIQAPYSNWKAALSVPA